MDVKVCYKKMGGNYEQAARLMGSDERILKYLKLFQGDMNFYALCSAVKENDFKTAFNAAHTLKGLALNLSLTSLADRTKELTELLRGGDPGEGLASLLERTTRTYASVLECINTLRDE